MIRLESKNNLSCPTGESLLKACGDYRLALVVVPYNWPAEASQKVAADLLNPQKQIGQSFEEAIREFRFGPVNVPSDLLAPVARKAIIHTFEHEEGPDVNQAVVENICAILSSRPPLTQEEILRARGKTLQEVSGLYEDN